jgi:hypothetical protein
MGGSPYFTESETEMRSDSGEKAQNAISRYVSSSPSRFVC